MAKTKDCETCGATFEKTGQADKFCLDCRDVKDGKPKTCSLCGDCLPVCRGPKKYCKACAEKATKIRDKSRTLKNSEGRCCVVSFPVCVVCSKRFSRSNSRSGMIEVCGKNCLAIAYQSLSEQSRKWKESPFQFKLDPAAAYLKSRLKRESRERHVAFCEFCGCAKVMGDAQARSVRNGGRFFCDQDCSWNWKSIHYASANHKPFEESRQRTKARKAVEAEQLKKRKEEREIARMLRPANAKTPGYYTCIICKKTEWVEQRSQKKYCSRRCRSKSVKAKISKKNRRHRIRSFGVSQLISLDELMKKSRRRCKHCSTLCVKPEGCNYPNEGTIDHVMPLSKGGLHLWSNVQLLCRRCNTIKRDKVMPGTQLMLRFE